MVRGGELKRLAVRSACNGEKRDAAEGRDYFLFFSFFLCGPMAAEGTSTQKPRNLKQTKSGEAKGQLKKGWLISFETLDGNAERRFTERPFGMAFFDTPEVTRVVSGGRAEALGVKPGWKVRAIDGEDIGDRDFMAMYRRMTSVSGQEAVPPREQEGDEGDEQECAEKFVGPASCYLCCCHGVV